MLSSPIRDSQDGQWTPVALCSVLGEAELGWSVSIVACSLSRGPASFSSQKME